MEIRGRISVDCLTPRDTNRDRTNFIFIERGLARDRGQKHVGGYCKQLVEIGGNPRCETRSFNNN